jgi:hypothetical protein
MFEDPLHPGPVTPAAVVDSAADRPRFSEIPFDDAFEDIGLAAESLRSEATRSLTRALGLSQKSANAARIAKSSSGVDIFFSKETVAELRDGVLHLPIDRRTGLLRIDARDGASRVRELGKVRPRRWKAVTSIVAAAQLISAIDTQLQLQDLNRKIDKLSRFVHADRLGELRGLYNALCRALHIRHPYRRHEELRRITLQIDQLAGRFFQTAIEKVQGISDPSQIGVLDALFSLQSTAEAELTAEIESAFADLRGAEFAWFLQALVLTELDDVGQLRAHARRMKAEIVVLGPLLVDRAGYLDFGLRDQLSDRLERERAALRVSAAPEIRVLAAQEGDGGARNE